MKKFFFILAAVSLLFISCKKEKRAESSESVTSGSDSSYEFSSYSESDHGSASLSSSILLDYTTEHAEPKLAPGKVSTDYSSSGEKSLSFVQGLRNLADYKTKYSTEKLSLAEYLKRNGFKDRDNSILEGLFKKPVRTSQNITDNKKNDKKVARKPFEVRYISNPTKGRNSVKVEFTVPVCALESLGDQDQIDSRGKKIFEIKPSIKGHYNFPSTEEVLYVFDEYPDPYVNYTINFSDKLVSSSGGDFVDEKIKNIKLEPRVLDDIFPGPKGHSYDSSSGLSSELARTFIARFDNLISQDEIQEKMTVTFSSGNSSKKLPYSLDIDDSSSSRVSSDRRYSDTYIVRIEDNGVIQPDGLITVSFGSEKELCYKTEVPFYITDIDVNFPYYQCYPSITIRFSTAPDIMSLRNCLSVKNGSVDYSDISTGYGAKTVYISRVIVGPDEECTLKIPKTVKAKNGLTLREEKSVTVTGHEINGYMRFIDSGIKMLEAQFRPKLIFEFMNAQNVGYNIGRAYALDLKRYVGYDEITSSTIYSSECDNLAENIPKNTRRFEEIDLFPYLDDGKGWVRFRAAGTVSVFNWDRSRGTETYTNWLDLQVTNIGASVRYGYNKAAVLVTRLSDGKPIKNAKVTAYIACRGNENFVESAYTNEKGLAVVSLIRNSDSVLFDGSDRSLVLYIEDDVDKIKFIPSGHDRYQNGIRADDPYEAQGVEQKTFMYSDRSLYKPGETVTVCGIDRSLYKTSGRYSNKSFCSATISLVENSYYDPEVYKTINVVTSANGTFSGSFDIPQDFEPGKYRIKYSRDYGKSDDVYEFITVANFEPLKIQGEVKTGEKTIYSSDIIESEFKATYLAGGPLAGSGVEVQVYSQPVEFNPGRPELSDYSFNDENISSDISHEKSSYDLTLDDEGKAYYSFKTNYSHSPKNYRFEFSTSDESNQVITVTKNVLVHSASCYVGIGPVTSGFGMEGKKVELPLVIVGTDGETVKDYSTVCDDDFDYTIYKKKWYYDIRQSVDDSYYSNWQYEKKTESEGSISLKNGMKASFVPKSSGWYVLKLTGTDKRGYRFSAEKEFYVTGSSSYYGNSSEGIRLSTDKKLYEPGETARIVMESPLAEGDYLITVEREGIFTEEVRHIDSPTSVLDVKIAREFFPVAYVSVSSFTVRDGMPMHGYGEPDFDKPKGIYGVVPVFIDKRVKAFNVKFEFDKAKYTPGENAEITLKAERGGKPVAGAELTVMGVDRAILDLVNYHVSDPLEFFFNTSNFPLYSTGGDSRRYLMDPVTYSIKDLQGGDNGLKEQERKDFRPTAFLEHGIVTDEKGIAHIKFKTPSNLSTFRVTAVGVAGELLSLNEDEFVVQNPINVQAVQPKVLRTRDTAECGVLVTNLSSESQEVNVALNIDCKAFGNEESSNGIVVENGSAFVDGANSCKIKVAPGRSACAYFDVAAEKAGMVDLVYSIDSGLLKEKLHSEMKIEKTYLYETVAISGCLETVVNSAAAESQGLIVPGYCEDNMGEVKFTLDASRMGLLSSSVHYVFDYPYGCMEQRSSKVLPLIIFGKYIKALGMDSKVTDPKKAVKSEMAYWKRVQKKNGSFAYWPDGDGESLYVTSRVALICAIGKANGYSDSDLSINIRDLKDWLKNKVRYNGTDARTKITAIYALTMLDKDYGDSELRSFLNDDSLDDLYIACYTGLSYLNKGKDRYRTEIDKCAGRIRERLSYAGRQVSVKWDGSESSWYLSKAGYLARMLQIFVQIDPTDRIVDAIWNSVLCYQSTGGYWSSTATTSAVLEAAATMIRERKLDKTDLRATVEFNGNKIAENKFSSMADAPFEKIVRFSDPSVTEKNKVLPIEISAKGTGTLFYAMEMKYALPDELQSARNNGLKVDCQLFEHRTGKEIKPVNNIVMELESGKVYRMMVKVTAEKDSNYVALRVPVPSGAGLIDPEFVTVSSSDIAGLKDSCYDKKYFMANEVRYFRDNMSKDESATYEFTFRADRRGVYPVPSAISECMYEPESFGRTDGLLYTIK